MALMEKRAPKARAGYKTVALALLASTIPVISAQSCVSLAGSSQCSAFNSSSVSTDSDLVKLYPFLAFVSSREEFDQQLSEYVQQDYVRSKYQDLIGCTNVTLSNTTSYYARYTTSVICNAIVQNSIKPCNLAATDSRPLCADSCVQQATSEELIAINSELCGSPDKDYISEIRADFTNCALPADSLSGSCIDAELNEPDECGYSTNLQGLCGYCAASSPNATDSCCVNSNVTGRCSGVTLPSTSSMPPLFPSSTSSSIASATSAPDSSGAKHGLSGGAIAGIVIGSIAGLALLLALLALLCICLRRRRGSSQNGSVFNQPSPKRAHQPSKGFSGESEMGSGGRVARMAALEAESGDEKGHAASAMAGGNRTFMDPSSDSEPYQESPPRGAPVTGRRNGSLSSNSVFNGLGGDETSPSDHNQYSSPGMTSGQSEQLPFFKDYYSQDEIHPGDKVATLWAYAPRAADEFELERGDMLRVVGIWDDGWATAIRIDDRAEDYDGKHKGQRDSGISHGTGGRDSRTPQGDIKAFPLVCVCLPEHWKKTVDGDGSTDTTSPSNQGGQPPFGNF